MPITGYRLEVADFGSTEFVPIYEGINKPAQLSFLHE
jgi:hypothetical protein